MRGYFHWMFILAFAIHHTIFKLFCLVLSCFRIYLVSQESCSNRPNLQEKDQDQDWSSKLLCFFLCKFNNSNMYLCLRGIKYKCIFYVPNSIDKIICTYYKLDGGNITRAAKSHSIIWNFKRFEYKQKIINTIWCFQHCNNYNNNNITHNNHMTTRVFTIRKPCQIIIWSLHDIIILCVCTNICNVKNNIKG